MTDAAKSDHMTKPHSSFNSPKTSSGSEASSRRGILTSTTDVNSKPSHDLYGQESPESRPRAPVSPDPTRRPKPIKGETQAPVEAVDLPLGQPRESPTPTGKENSLATWYSSSDQESPTRSGSSTAEMPHRQSHSPVRKLSLTPPSYPSDQTTQPTGFAETPSQCPQASPETPAGGGTVPQQGLTASALKKAADPFVPSFKTKDIAPTPVPGRISKAGGHGKRQEKARAKPKPWQERMAEQVTPPPSPTPPLGPWQERMAEQVKEILCTVSLVCVRKVEKRSTAVKTSVLRRLFAQ